MKRISRGLSPTLSLENRESSRFKKFWSFDRLFCGISTFGREQGWRSDESTRHPPMRPGFDSRSTGFDGDIWVEFVFGSQPCSEDFSPGIPVFLPPQKPTFLNSNSTWKQWMTDQLCESHWNSHLLIPSHLRWRTPCCRTLLAVIEHSSRGHTLPHTWTEVQTVYLMSDSFNLSPFP